jgi:hypothetical protein
VKIQAHERTRLRVLRYGEDDRVPNPGDLLLVSTVGDGINGSIEMAVLINGREMAELAKDVNAAVLEWEANKDWLSEPVTKRRAS